MNKRLPICFALLVATCLAPTPAPAGGLRHNGITARRAELYAQPLPAASPEARAFRDPQGRYSLTLPDGWNATTDSSGTTQLSFGPNWATLLATGGSQPIDVNHQILQQIQAQYKEFRLLNEGNLQVNGHAAHGSNATGINPKGVHVSLLVISISAGNGHFLTVVSSAPNDQAKAVNGVIMQITQSIRFAGE